MGAYTVHIPRFCYKLANLHINEANSANVHIEQANSGENVL